MLLTDVYPQAGASRASGGLTAPLSSLQASASVSQSASGSIAAQGAPAVWFLVLVGVALLMLHMGDM